MWIKVKLVRGTNVNLPLPGELTLLSSLKWQGCWIYSNLLCYILFEMYFIILSNEHITYHMSFIMRYEQECHYTVPMFAPQPGPFSPHLPSYMHKYVIPHY